MSRLRFFIYHFLTVITGALILSTIGLYNGYPLVFSDTGTYILSGFNDVVPVDRPVMYGRFLSLFSFEHSLWWVIWAQNLLTSFVLFAFLGLFFSNFRQLRATFLFCVLLLTLASGIAWYSNQLMPDFFAPLFLLCFYTLLMGKKSGLLMQVALYLILLLSLLVHFSHLMLGVVVVLLTLFLKFTMNRKLRWVPVKRVLALSVITLSGWLIVPCINLSIESEFSLSKGSHVFLMGHLADTGILRELLQEKCGEPEFESLKLCAFKDSLPTNAAGFIWSGEILQTSGGWENSKDEYQKIINASLTDPHYLFRNVFVSVTYGLVQLTDNKIGHGLSAYVEKSAPYMQVREEFGHELNPYMNSRQNRYNGYLLDLETVNDYQELLLLLSLFSCFILLPRSLRASLNRQTLWLIGFAVFFIVSNSFITAGLNSPYGRLQARVVWLFPLAMMVLVIKNFSLILAYIRRHLSSEM